MIQVDDLFLEQPHPGADKSTPGLGMRKSITYVMGFRASSLYSSIVEALNEVIPEAEIRLEASPDAPRT